jgi:hypothetical protein
MVILLLIALTAGRPGHQDHSQTFDMAEYNHLYEGEELKFSQVVLYSWNPQYVRWHVEAWYIVDKENAIREAPSKVGNRWVMYKGKTKIYAKRYRETWTVSDPERDNKILFNEKFRVGLLPR